MNKKEQRKVNHGGDWSGFLKKRGHMPLDFSANVSPLGMPPSAFKAIESLSVSDLARYPDPECLALRLAIAGRYGIRDDQIFCANGAADIIYRLAYSLSPKRAVLAAPDFGEYAEALTNVGADITYYMTRKKQSAPDDKGKQMDFAVDRGILSYINRDTDLVIFSSPNNPSGCVTDTAVLHSVLDKCIECGALLVIDECFLDFLPDARERTMLSHLGKSDGRLLVLRAFTKFYGMAGLRLGWCASDDPDLLENLRRSGPPWQVSTAAQAAGVAALTDTAYEEELRSLTAGERLYMQEALRSRGFLVIPSRTNYIMFYSEDHELHEELLEHGIMIRDCSDYPGLSAGWYRVAVRTREENEILLSHLPLRRYKAKQTGMRFI